MQSFGSALVAAADGDGGFRDPEKFCNISDNSFVGLPFNWRRCNRNLEGTCVDTAEAVGRGLWLEMHNKKKGRIRLSL